MCISVKYAQLKFRVLVVFVKKKKKNIVITNEEEEKWYLEASYGF